MTLPAPNLDDRRAQDIVDEAKRRLAALVPAWTDHNVSDPGVALIELFAWMTDMTLYRLNQVPDRLYVKFLELVGIELFSSVPSRGHLLFWLTAAQEETVRIPAGTQVSTHRSGTDDPVVFCTEFELAIVTPELVSCLTSDGGTALVDHWDELSREATAVELFSTLQPGEAFYLGFAQSLGGNVLRLEVVTGPEGSGVAPDNPPVAWEAWDGRSWSPARVLQDTSAAFNDNGAIDVLVPDQHPALPLGSARAHWVRCRLVEPDDEGSRYTNPPVLERVTPSCIGGQVAALHAEPAPAEVLGTSSGEPGQRFVLRRRPVLPRRSGETVRVLAPDRDAGSAGPAGLPSARPGDAEETPWREVADFFDAGEDDRVFTWSGSTGEITFGPRIFDRTGRGHQHGAVPPLDSRIVVTGYRYGGGSRGNVGPGRLRVMQTSVPFVDRVTNPLPMTGGADPESIENAKIRGPFALRSGARAVTAQDFERAAMDAARGVARARCMQPAASGEPARLLIVPRVDRNPAELVLNDLVIPPDLENRIKAYLEPRRLLTMRVAIQTPVYVGVTVTARVQAAPGVGSEVLRDLAQQRLFEFINPLTGGPSGQGWPFEHALTVGDIYAVLAGLPGLQSVREMHFLSVDLLHPEATERVDREILLRADALFMSYGHRVVVET
jgi:predicted phage baseplate assembly protein